MILSIESSCDDSSIAITRIEDNKLLFHKKISQDAEHSVYGGVVPELAARLHATALPKILEECREFFPHLKAVAVTSEPGLTVSLVEGISMAKALSIALNIPLIGVNHLTAHIYSLFIEQPTHFPQTVLLVSGGHTQILQVSAYNRIELIGSTTDDSFGESFDKVAKMLGLGYPGGPIVEEYAKKGDAFRFDYTVPMLKRPEIAFSFSGLKNSVRLSIDKLGELSDQDRYDICASFQRVAIKHLTHKCKKLFESGSIKAFAIVGGASANLTLRQEFDTLCTKYRIKIDYAALPFCSDNAAMVGRCAVDMYHHNAFTPLGVLEPKARVNWSNA
jgi:N6-L-threonylcarbamoyladenine synthase